jgi:hypothetical protein
MFAVSRTHDQESCSAAPCYGTSAESLPLHLSEIQAKPSRDVEVDNANNNDVTRSSRSTRAQELRVGDEHTIQHSFVNVEDGLLSLSIQKRPLQWVLSEISRQSGVSIISAQELATELISEAFQDLPLDRGLQRLLSTSDTFFFYSGENMLSPLRAVWVYQKGKGDGIVPVPPSAWASTEELEQDLMDPNPEVRARSVETLVEREGQDAEELVLRALEDGNDHVRSRALDVAVTSGVKLPIDTLTDLTEYDPSPLVRTLALVAIAGVAENSGPEELDIRPLAERALSDPAPDVKAQAQQILEQIDIESAGDATRGLSAPDAGFE